MLRLCCDCLGVVSLLLACGDVVCMRLLCDCLLVWNYSLLVLCFVIPVAWCVGLCCDLPLCLIVGRLRLVVPYGLD